MIPLIKVLILLLNAKELKNKNKTITTDKYPINEISNPNEFGKICSNSFEEILENSSK
jgi:hypothetical protein